MLIEQIFELKWRGAWVPRPYMYSNNCLLHDKTKIFMENLWVDYYLLFKYCKRQCALLSPTANWAKSLTKFSTKMYDLKNVFGLKL